ncbi:MAG: hypothetical protein ACXAC0_10265 [Candidatus Thorarchaeota archaeon]|jgi:hypothetical protein
MARKVNTYSWALASIFGAIQFVIVILPFKIAVSVMGSYLPLYLISASVIGYLLGPRYGAVAVFIGTLIGGIFHPLFTEPTFGGLRYFIAIAPTSGALVAGLIKTKRFTRVPVVYFVAILAMVVFSVIVKPLAFTTLIFLWFHLVSFISTLPFFLQRFRNGFANGLDLFPSMKSLLGGLTIWYLLLTSVMVSLLFELALKTNYLAVFTLLANPEYSSTILVFLDAYFSRFYSSTIFVYPIETILSSIIGWVIIFLIMIVQTRFLSTATSPVEIEE